MRTVAVVQARVGSARLPAKVLLPLGGHTVLGQVVRRAGRAGVLEEVVVATSTLPEDDEVIEEARRAGVQAVRGPLDDVLERYRIAARAASADHVVRITADCPCVDPCLIDRLVGHHQEIGADYTSNIRPRTFPHGLDLEAFTRDALEEAADSAVDPAHREHVTPFLWTQPQRFRIGSITATEMERNPDLRVTLDVEEDYVALQALFDLLGQDFGAAELVAAAAKHPWLPRINAGVRQKAPVKSADAAVRVRLEVSETAAWAVDQEHYLAARLLLEALRSVDPSALGGEQDVSDLRRATAELAAES